MSAAARFRSSRDLGTVSICAQQLVTPVATQAEGLQLQPAAPVSVTVTVEYGSSNSGIRA